MGGVRNTFFGIYFTPRDSSFDKEFGRNFYLELLETVALTRTSDETFVFIL